MIWQANLLKAQKIDQTEVQHSTGSAWRSGELPTEFKRKKHTEGGSREGLLGGYITTLLKHAGMELGKPELIWS